MVVEPRSITAKKKTRLQNERSKDELANQPGCESNQPEDQLLGQQARLQESVVCAISERWSGRLIVKESASKQQTLGQIVFHEGQIAWAVFRHQEETLGTFLHRLGRITREELDRVKQIYAASDGKKKFGAILEECGVMQGPVLRRCLMLHIRQALVALFQKPLAMGIPCQYMLEIDKKTLFQPEEVLPLKVSTDLFKRTKADFTERAEHWHRLGRDNAVLRDFMDVTDYMASAIVSSDGEVIAAHIGSRKIDPYLLSVFIASMVEASSRAVAQTDLGQIETLTLECSEGCMVTRWVDKEKRYLTTVLIARASSMGSAKLRLKRSTSSVCTWLMQKGHAEMQAPLESL